MRLVPFTMGWWVGIVIVILVTRTKPHWMAGAIGLGLIAVCAVASEVKRRRRRGGG